MHMWRWYVNLIILVSKQESNDFNPIAISIVSTTFSTKDHHRQHCHIFSLLFLSSWVQHISWSALDLRWKPPPSLIHLAKANRANMITMMTSMVKDDTATPNRVKLLSRAGWVASFSFSRSKVHFPSTCWVPGALGKVPAGLRTCSRIHRMMEEATTCDNIFSSWVRGCWNGILLRRG